ncbi:uncharacterized protein EV420DRAFT_1546715 [Desarmillaria tabescens]|uniref:Zn(2)-C6 fungal-type domain-containing protein n=1 Tax=Armillaria tabescens TaxID=1929756 RepID=A0AA39N4A5_ARMTA|nr:uncharacterized protein EV420DRAFT_1546715 [Desarmillaria tabescens]KAK0457651.1 hypothetical protein EV420DRAFT_1546715 [Desarmillaria tabescens]
MYNLSTPDNYPFPADPSSFSTTMTSDHTRRQTDSANPSRKSALSCAECRRSKLRCDRVFPCQSCIRRGCAGICPDVIMAHAEKLAEEVKVLTARIHDLEDALSSRDGASHPLLQGRDPQRDEIDALYEKGLQEVSDAIGSLAIGSDGQAKYYGETAGSEYLGSLLPEEEIVQEERPKDLDLPLEILDLVNAFPLGMKECNYSKFIFAPYLPTQERAMYLAELYYQNTAWMYDPIVQQDFVMNILTPLYFAPGFTTLETIHAHKLAVFFMAMGDGVLYDSSPDSAYLSEQYHALAQAAMSIEPLLMEATSATVQALFMMFRFIYNSDRKSNETRWILAGLCGRIAQSVNRDSSGWNLNPEELQRRRRLFWELYTHDAWTSIVNGRPPALMIQHTDCRFPDDLDPVVKPTGEVELGWHAWKFRYSASCLSISIQHIFTTRAPNYKALLDLDKKIRKFPVAHHLLSPIETSEPGRAWSSNRVHALQQYCVVCERESNLLYIHRSYFAQAIQGQSRNPLQHMYAPSVLATYRSACRLISSLRGLNVVLGALVVESPSCSLSQDALILLNQTIPFYDEGSRRCRPANTLPMLHKLRDHDRSCADPDAPDELAVLGGRKSVINKKASSHSPSSNDSHQISGSYIYGDGSDSGGSGSGGDALMDYYDDLGTSGLSPTYQKRYDLSLGDISPSSAHQYVQPQTQTSSYPMQSRAQVQQMYTSNVQSVHPSFQAISVDQALAPMGYAFSATQDQTQDDIWRNFVREFGLEHI